MERMPELYKGSGCVQRSSREYNSLEDIKGAEASIVPVANQSCSEHQKWRSCIRDPSLDRPGVRSPLSSYLDRRGSCRPRKAVWSRRRRAFSLFQGVEARGRGLSEDGSARNVLLWEKTNVRGVSRMDRMGSKAWVGTRKQKPTRLG